MRKKVLAKGFSAIELLFAVLVLAALSLTGWLAWRHTHKSTTVSPPMSHINKPPAPRADNYAGWSTGSSPRAKFSLRYPSSWVYAQTVGDKDNVEHITLDSENMHITIDSYIGKGNTNGGAPGTTCSDCTQTISSMPFSIPAVGSASIDTVRYALDAGSGNALIVRLSDGSYYIPSGSVANVYSAFRAISKLDSVGAYQQETLNDFKNNPGYATAQKILTSIAY